MSIWQENTLFGPSKSASIAVPDNHELVRITGLIDWVSLTHIAMTCREKTRKRLTGVESRYRQLLGALVLMATRGCNYRDAEDLISFYAPARYLCDLMDSEIGLDHVTIFEFTQMLGPTGMESINKVILQHAVKVGKMRGKFDAIKTEVKEASARVRGLLRNSHLFAKGRDQKRKIERKMYHTVNEIQKKIASAIESGASVKSRGGQELKKVNSVMKRLLPQMKHFFNTGFVAGKKILHLHMDDVYSIVRGKAGKSVEFGIKLGINRLGGGFVQGFTLENRKHGADTAFCKQSIREHQEVFNHAPKIFGYDRGGDSDANICFAIKSGVKHVGIAPRGKRAWPVSKTMAERIRCERAQVEGSIGTIKSSRYGFTKPRAFSTAALERCGHRAILGFNLRKMAVLAGTMVPA